MAGDDIRLTELINRLEPDMTSPTQRRHDEILGRLDALIDAVQSTTARDHLHRLLAEESAAERRDEPVDVTEEPPGLTALLRRALGDDTVNATVTDEPVDTAPDVDPDERQSHPGVLWDKIDALTADVERLTREHDAKQGRVEELIRERGQAIERYKALREDVTAHAHHHAHAQSGLAFDCFATILEDDDKRGRDA